MKSFIRRTLAQTLTVCALSWGAIAAIESVSTRPAFALSEQEIATRLATVPGFVIGVGENLVSYPVGQAEGETAENHIVPVFMTRQEAEKYITESRTREDLPALPPEAVVVSRSLQYLYTLEQTSQTEGDRKLNLFYVPEPEEVQQATSLNAEFSQGVPLFYPQFEDGSIVSINQNNGESIFPMFFSREDLDSLLTDLNSRSSEARGVIQVGVVPLEFLINQMRTTEDDTFDQVRLLPASDVVNDIQRNQ